MVLVTDLRMGQEPAYIFSFAFADRSGAALLLNLPRHVGVRPDLGRGLPWLWRRLRGEVLAPPR